MAEANCGGTDNKIRGIRSCQPDVERRASAARNQENAWKKIRKNHYGFIARYVRERPEQEYITILF